VSTRRLGKSDLNITPVGFGAWAIGGTGYDFAWGKQDDADSIAAIHRSLELGVNWIDTAPVYGTGHSEEIVASALKERRGSRPYVFTKCVMHWDEKGYALPRFLIAIPSAANATTVCAACGGRHRSLSDALAAGRQLVLDWRKLGKQWPACKKKGRSGGSASRISPSRRSSARRKLRR
jgi:aryl-alcohol dehydrogenase-like predicted oxidoreductase